MIIRLSSKIIYPLMVGLWTLTGLRIQPENRSGCNPMGNKTNYLTGLIWSGLQPNELQPRAFQSGLNALGCNLVYRVQLQVEEFLKSYRLVVSIRLNILGCNPLGFNPEHFQLGWIIWVSVRNIDIKMETRKFHRVESILGLIKGLSQQP